MWAGDRMSWLNTKVKDITIVILPVLPLDLELQYVVLKEFAFAFWFPHPEFREIMDLKEDSNKINKDF